MNGYQVGVAYAEKIDAAGLPATVDPRSAAPPCVLIGETGGDVATYCSKTVNLYAAMLLPGPWNADAWRLASEIEAFVWQAIPVTGYRYVLYRLALDAPPIPAYLFTWTEEVQIGEPISPLERAA